MRSNSYPQGHKRRIQELEARQKVLECSFRGLRQLRQELVSLNRECEKNEANIHGFLSSFIPEYKSFNENLDQNNNDNNEYQKKERHQRFQGSMLQNVFWPRTSALQL